MKWRFDKDNFPDGSSITRYYASTKTKDAIVTKYNRKVVELILRKTKIAHEGTKHEFTYMKPNGTLYYTTVSEAKEIGERWLNDAIQ